MFIDNDTLVGWYVINEDEVYQILFIGSNWIVYQMDIAQKFVIG